MSTITFVTAYAKSERQALADLLLDLGPDEPTLCEGWTTRDLAAHLVIRDRRLDAALGSRIKALHDHGERIRRAKAAEPYDAVVRQVRTPPVWSPVSNPLADETFNLGEFFIHQEDVRRARPGWEPRELDPGMSRALWRTLKLTGRLVLRGAGFGVAVRSGPYGSFTVGEAPQVVLSGPPGELTLFLAGRQRAARVEITGPADQAENLRTSSFAI